MVRLHQARVADEPMLPIDLLEVTQNTHDICSEGISPDYPRIMEFFKAIDLLCKPWSSPTARGSIRNFLRRRLFALKPHCHFQGEELHSGHEERTTTSTSLYGSSESQPQVAGG
jgi:hypothetical protein